MFLAAASDDGEARAILDVIRSLPDAYRETLVLRLVEGMSGQEIADRTGLTPASVRVNLHRGMKLLRARLEGVAPVADDYLWDRADDPIQRSSVWSVCSDDFAPRRRLQWMRSSGSRPLVTGADHFDLQRLSRGGGVAVVLRAPARCGRCSASTAGLGDPACRGGPGDRRGAGREKQAGSP